MIDSLRSKVFVSSKVFTPKVFASSSPGFLPWDQDDVGSFTPEALANTFGVMRLTRTISQRSRFAPWAEIRERLRRKNFVRKPNNYELATLRLKA
jgi:hypothetical protein